MTDANVSQQSVAPNMLGTQTPKRPQFHNTILAIIFLALLGLAGLVLVPHLVNKDNIDVMKAGLTAYMYMLGIMATSVTGGHVFDLAGGGGGLMNMFRTIGTSAPPYGMSNSPYGMMQPPYSMPNYSQSPYSPPMGTVPPPKSNI